MDQDEMPEIVWEKKLYFDYFYERPIGLIFYSFMLLVIGLMRILGNTTVVILKMKKFKALNGLELITTFFISLDLIYEVVHDFLFVEIFYHEFHSTGNCNIIHFTYQYIRNFMRCVVFAIVIISKFYPEITRKNATIVIGVLLVISTGISLYFRIKYIAVLTRLNADGKPHHICYPEVQHWDEYFEISPKVVASFPMTLIFITSIFLLIWRKTDHVQNRDTLQYGMVMSGIFCILSVSYLFRIIIDVGWGVDYGISISSKFLLALNSFVYCYFHRVFFREVCISLHLLPKNSLFHEILDENGYE